MLKILYKSKKIQKICTNYSFAKKEHGDKMAGMIHLRIDQIQSADSIEMLVKHQIGRCHALKGNRLSEYAMDLVHPVRLVFKGHADIDKVIIVIAIEDYH